MYTHTHSLPSVVNTDLVLMRRSFVISPTISLLISESIGESQSTDDMNSFKDHKRQSVSLVVVHPLYNIHYYLLINAFFT